MKRAVTLLGLLLFGWGTFTGIRQFNAIAKNMEYFSENAPNIQGADQKKIAAKILRTKIRKVKDPETIFEEADYLVKIRIFKKLVIPATNQEIYIDARGFGSGFMTDDKTICKKSKYCVVTAFHVVDDNSMTYFAEPKDGSRAQLLELTRGSTTYDFAVLRFVDYDYVPKKVATIGRSSSLKPGSRIYTMGSNRFGDFWFSPDGHLYTSSKAAGPELAKNLEAAGMNHPELLLFHTPLFHGFSGGPLVNKYGEVIGITIGYTGLDEEPIYMGSPIDGIKKTLKKMK